MISSLPHVLTKRWRQSRVSGAPSSNYPTCSRQPRDDRGGTGSPRSYPPSGAGRSHFHARGCRGGGMKNYPATVPTKNNPNLPVSKNRRYSPVRNRSYRHPGIFGRYRSSGAIEDLAPVIRRWGRYFTISQHDTWYRLDAWICGRCRAFVAKHWNRNPSLYREWTNHRLARLGLPCLASMRLPPMLVSISSMRPLRFFLCEAGISTNRRPAVLSTPSAFLAAVDGLGLV